MRVGRLARGAAIGLLLILCAACNPLETDPEHFSDLDLTSVRYAGPAPAWIDVSVEGAPDHQVYVLSLVRDDDLTGPTDRSCHTPAGVAPCLVSVGDVWMPGQVVVVGDGSESVRQMQVWPGEQLQTVVVCVDPVTHELACPPEVRTTFAARAEDGSLIGNLRA